MPKRIQLSRKKGWRLPEGAVNVARPTRWGNPFWHAQKIHGVELSLALYRNMANGIWSPSVVKDIPMTYYEEHCAWLKRIGRHPAEVARTDLRGHDLACWCRMDALCHADILLEIANA